MCHNSNFLRPLKQSVHFGVYVRIFFPTCLGGAEAIGRGGALLLPLPLSPNAHHTKGLEYMFQLLVGIAVRTVRFAGRISQFFLAAQVFFNFTIASTATISSFSNAPFTGHRSLPCRSVSACTSLTSRWCVGHSFKPKTRRETGLVGAGRHKTLAPHPTLQPSRTHTQNINVT